MYFFPICASTLLTLPMLLGSSRYSLALRRDVRHPLQTVSISLRSFCASVRFLEARRSQVFLSDE